MSIEDYRLRATATQMLAHLFPQEKLCNPIEVASRDNVAAESAASGSANPVAAGEQSSPMFSLSVIAAPAGPSQAAKSSDVEMIDAPSHMSEEL
jgi:hypothetical protein